MPFYDDLAQRYGMTGMVPSAGFAQDLFGAGLGALGNKYLQAGMTGDMGLLGGPMVSDVMNQMKQQEFQRQQLLEKIQREEAIQQFNQRMDMQQAGRLDDRFAFDQGEAEYRHGRDDVADELARERMASNERVAGSYQRGRRPAQGMGGPVDISSSATAVQSGDYTPQDVQALLSSGMITSSQAGNLLSPGQGDAGNLTDQEDLRAKYLLGIINSRDRDVTEFQKMEAERELQQLSGLTQSGLQNPNVPGILANQAADGDMIPTLLDNRKDAAIDGLGVDEGAGPFDLTPDEKRGADKRLEDFRNAPEQERQQWAQMHNIAEKVLAYMREMVGE